MVGYPREQRLILTFLDSWVDGGYVCTLRSATSLQIVSSKLLYFFFYLFFSSPTLFSLRICSVLLFTTIQPSQSCFRPYHFIFIWRASTILLTTAVTPLHILRLSSLDFTFSVRRISVVYFSLLWFLFHAFHSSMNLSFLSFLSRSLIFFRAAAESNMYSYYIYIHAHDLERQNP